MTRIAGQTGHLADHNRWDQFIDDVTNGVITVGPAGAQGPQGPEAEVPIVFNRSGALSVGSGTGGFPVPYACVITSVRGYVGTAPTGAAVIIDVNKNGSTIFGNQSLRPKANAGSQSIPENIDATVNTAAEGDVLTVDIDQVGSIVSGSNLVVVITVRKS